MSADYFIRPLDFAQTRPDKAFKHTFLQTERLLTGLNCLAPGQEQHLHDHPEQDKFYYVLAGEGDFTVGATTQTCSAGMLILAPAGIPHGVVNASAAPLTFLTVIAPWPRAA